MCRSRLFQCRIKKSCNLQFVVVIKVNLLSNSNNLWHLLLQEKDKRIEGQRKKKVKKVKKNPINNGMQYTVFHQI